MAQLEGKVLSTPLAADFGPGGRGAELDGEIAFYTSRRRLLAWSGVGAAAEEGAAGR